MSMELRVVVFDVDGTLIDSQAHILAAMRDAFAAIGHEAPPREKVLAGVGLSLPVLMHTLAPDLSDSEADRLVQAYKASWLATVQGAGALENIGFFSGMRELLDRLREEEETLLAVATGKSRRGLDRLIEQHRLEGYFQSVQVADDHPSKPHPAMLLAVADDLGVETARAVMIGDTSYDMEMARAAGMARIGVGWGYHPRERLADAEVIVDDAWALERALSEWKDRLQ